MKFVNSLTEDQIKELSQVFKCSESHRSRQRAHAILLSNKKYKINQIAEIFDVDRDTVSLWIRNWESEGICCLADKQRSGRPSILNDEDQIRLAKLIKDNPHQTRTVHAQLTSETRKEFSLCTMKRTLKKNRHAI